VKAPKIATKTKGNVTKKSAISAKVKAVKSIVKPATKPASTGYYHG